MIEYKIMLGFERKSMERFVSKSEKDTEGFAENFAKTLNKGDVIAFLGGLGAGKTAFTRGLARGLKCEDDVSSPTFAIVNEYYGETMLFHFDMYRIASIEELYSIGFFEYLDRGGVCAVEWSENILSALPQNTKYIKINRIDQNEREIIIFSEDEYDNFGN